MRAIRRSLTKIKKKKGIFSLFNCVTLSAKLKRATRLNKKVSQKNMRIFLIIVTTLV